MEEVERLHKMISYASRRLISVGEGRSGFHLDAYEVWLVYNAGRQRRYSEYPLICCAPDPPFQSPLNPPIPVLSKRGISPTEDVLLAFLVDGPKQTKELLKRVSFKGTKLSILMRNLCEAEVVRWTKEEGFGIPAR